MAQESRSRQSTRHACIHEAELGALAEKTDTLKTNIDTIFRLQHELQLSLSEEVLTRSLTAATVDAINTALVALQETNQAVSNRYTTVCRPMLAKTEENQRAIKEAHNIALELMKRLDSNDASLENLRTDLTAMNDAVAKLTKSIAIFTRWSVFIRWGVVLMIGITAFAANIGQLVSFIHGLFKHTPTP